MRHRNINKIFDRKKGPREALLRGLVQQVLLYEHVRTTRARAKAIQPLVEHAIEIAKAGTLASRRSLLRQCPDELAVRKAMDVLAPRFAKRAGGYTRLIPLPPRKGDAAVMARIELVA